VCPPFPFVKKKSTSKHGIQTEHGLQRKFAVYVLPLRFEIIGADVETNGLDADDTAKDMAVIAEMLVNRPGKTVCARLTRILT